MFLDKDIKEFEELMIQALEILYCFDEVDKNKFKQQLSEFERDSKRIYSLLIKKKYILETPPKRDKIKITEEGLDFLRDCQKEKSTSEITKLTLFLTTILVITTIASFFDNLTTINPLWLALIYGIFTFIIYLYFKKSKSIKF